MADYSIDDILAELDAKKSGNKSSYADTGSKTEKSSSYDIVKSFTENTLGKFSKQDALLSCPSLGSSSVESALKKLVEEGAIIKTGAGRKTMYMRNIN